MLIRKKMNLGAHGHSIDYVINQLVEVLVTVLCVALNIAIAVAVTAILIHIVKRAYPLYRSGLRCSRADPDGIPFGSAYGLQFYSPSGQEGHILAWGPSGSGKTAASLIPILKAFDGVGSYVIDISGDISRNVEKASKMAFEPESMDTVPFDVFHYVDVLPDDTDKDQALMRLAYMLLPPLSPQIATANALYFADEGRKILTAALLAFYHEGFDFPEICEKIVSLSYRQLFAEIDATGNLTAISFINGFEGSSEANTAGCRQSAVAAVDLFATNVYVHNAFRRPRMNEESVAMDSIETKHVFFLVSDANLDVYAQAVHLVTSLFLEYVGNRMNPGGTILLAIDELASFGRLDLINQLRKARKRKVRIFCLTQSLADLYLVYGHEETQAMLTNFSFKLILGAASAEDAEYVSRLIGKRKAKKRSVSYGMRGYSTTQTEEDEWIITPEQVSKLDKELLLIFRGGYLKMRKNYYFKIRKKFF